MTELNALTIAEARDALRKGEVTSVELTEACLKAIDAADALNAVVHKTPEIAMDRARPPMPGSRPATRRDVRHTGRDQGPLLHRRRAEPGRIADPRRVPPEYESTVRQLRDAGAVMLGKLNMDEFAMGSSNETSVYGNAVNPWRAGNSDAALTPGGSSGGSAAAVAADLCLGATGTDTGGSIRQPAAFTGTVGLKPTYGRCSRWGIVAFASSLDQAGPMTAPVRDAAIMRGDDGPRPEGQHLRRSARPDFEAMLTGDIRGKVIGIPKEYRMDGMPGEIETLWTQGAEMLKDAGATLRDITLPHTKYALPAYYVIAPAEASSNLARYDGVRYGYRAKLEQGDGVTEMYEKTRAEGFGAEVKRRVMIGHLRPVGGLLRRLLQPRAQGPGADQARLRHGLRRGIDAILTPATPSAAFELGEEHADPVADVSQRRLHRDREPRRPPRRRGADRASTSGPAARPAADRTPWEEGELLNTAYALEQAAGLWRNPRNGGKVRQRKNGAEQ
jgi:aspartyl-tRNA(Asn)/glutamyl-tRNA(Gln) amidotransferase subunit A